MRYKEKRYRRAQVIEGMLLRAEIECADWAQSERGKTPESNTFLFWAASCAIRHARDILKLLHPWRDDLKMVEQHAKELDDERVNQET